MFIITNEARAIAIASKYRKTVICSTSKNKKGVTLGDTKYTYRPTMFIPDEDTINGLISGDIKLKKVVKDAVKLIRTPNAKTEDNVSFSTELAIILGMSTSTRRSSDNGDRYKSAPKLVILLLDGEDKARDKILIKYLKAVLGEFGLTPLVDDGKSGTLTMLQLFCKMPKYKGDKLSGKKAKKAKKKYRKAINKMVAGEQEARFLKTRKIINNLTKYANRAKNGQLLSPQGVKYYKTMLVFYDIGLKAYAMDGLSVKQLNKSTAELWVKTLLQTYTGDNVGQISKDKVAKNLGKANKKAVNAYGVIKDILEGMDPNLDMPKVKYGHKKKGKGKKVKILGAKMKTKKFKKFFLKKENRPLIILIFAHTFACGLGYGPGDSPYNKKMKDVGDGIRPGFGKELVTAANAYAKALKDSEKAKAERKAEPSA